MKIRQAIDKISSLGYFSTAKWAVAHSLGLKDGNLILSLDRELNDSQEKKIEEIIARLKNDEPMQYVLGSWQFIDIDIITDKRALIPRPETEILAMEALKYAERIQNPSVADIGCGTGCIGLFIKSRLKDAKVTLADVSDDALSLARENAKILDFDCEIIEFDMLSDETLPCDIMVSNPPYIKSSDISGLDANVRDYEPRSALDGGADGLKYYRALERLALRSLPAGGVFLAELGIGQYEDVKEIFSNNFKNIHAVKDIHKIDRVFVAVRG